MLPNVNSQNILKVALLFIIKGLIFTSLIAQDIQEITVTIEGISSAEKLAHFNNAEELRKIRKYNNAIEEYEKVINGGEYFEKTAEGHYDIGICYTWLGKKNDAEAVFREVIKEYPDNNEVIAHTKYCLAWVDLQKGNYYSAIDRLQQTLDEQIYTDEEFCTKTLFQIGRIYQSFIHDAEKAEKVFIKIVKRYPNSEITNHPFFEKIKAEVK